MNGARMDNDAVGSTDHSHSYELLDGSAAKGHRDPNPMENLFDEKPSVISRWSPFLVLAMQTIVIVFMIVIIPIDIWMSDDQHGFSNTKRNIYATGVAILASLISACTVAEIRNLWLKNLVQGSSKSPAQTQRIQVLLAISKFRDQFIFYEISIALLVLGLITSALVGATTATVASRAYDTSQFLYNGGSTHLYTPGEPPVQNDCWTARESQQGNLAWLDGSSVFGFNRSSTERQCPNNIYVKASDISNGLGLGYNPFVPNSFCQLGIGGTVGCNALGSPVSSSSTCGILQAFGCQDRPLGADACVPVFAKNPVTCRPVDAEWILDKEGVIRILNGPSCQVTSLGTGEGLFINLYNKSIAGACSFNRPLGDLTILFGSTNITDIELLGPLLNQTVANSTNYAVECNITMTTILEFQKVMYQPDVTAFASPSYSRNIPVTNFVNGTKQSCDPTPEQNGMDPSQQVSQILNKQAKGAAAAFLALYFNKTIGAIVEETGFGLDPSASKLTTFLAFAGSANVLEDYLGVTVASYMSYYWSTGGDSSHNYPSYKVTYRLSAERVGSGSWWAILYILPSLFAIVVLCVLMQRSRRISR